MLEALRPLLEGGRNDLTALDFSSHQGFFSLELAKHCRRVLGLEFRQQNVESARLIRDTLDIQNVEFMQENIETMPAHKYEPADIVLCFGLVYHVENPIGVLRRARELTKQVLLVETQTTILDLEGPIDNGHHSWTRYMHGYFGVVEGDPDNDDGSVADIVLVPSPKVLIWLLRKLGFSKVTRLEPPQGAYQQLATHKRVMIEAWR